MRRVFYLFFALLLISSALKAQNRTITGKVTDENGLPLPGATITVKGSTTGSVTGTDGKYSIKATNLQTVVIGAKFIGYNYQEKALREGEMNADFKLLPSQSSLDEVVVVGYGTQKKTHLTGAIASVEMKNIQDIPTTNLAAALRGQLPNVSVIGGTARPGENATIQIRNPVFFAKDGKTDPLFIIDDNQRTLNDFNLLDASEVESISILKDAAAAIYGILGANGVVIVKTKRGQAGAPKVTYSGSYGISDAVELPHMMTGLQQATYLNDYTQTKNNYTLSPTGVIGTGTTKDVAYYSPDELDYFANNSSDHLREAWQSSYIMRHALTVSGGNDKATYFAGGTYTQQNSNFKGASTNKFTFRASADAKVASGLKVGLSLSGDTYYSKRYYFKQGSESLDNDFKSLLSIPQFQPMYYNGLPVLQASNTGSFQGANFFEIQKLNNYTSQNTTMLNVLANAEYEIPFIKGLKANVSYNRNINNDFSKQYGTRYNMYSFTNLGENKHIVGGDVQSVISAKNGDIVRFTPGITNVYQVNGNLTYAARFGKHDLSAIALFEQKHDSGESLQAFREGTLVGGFDNMQFATGAQSTDQANGRVLQFGRLAYAGRVNYAYADKYLVELSIRADANNNFAPGHQWGYFPSGSLGWVMSEEGFFKNNIKFVNFLKFRASVGLLGNDSSKPYLYQENYRLETGKGAVFGGNNDRGNTFAPNVVIANANTTWDSNLSTNFGIDAQFLDNRLSLTADGYFSHRYNVLSGLTSSVSVLIGTAPPTENFASVNTFGYEIALSWKDRIGKDFHYNFSPFLSWFDDKYLRADQQLGNIGTYLDATGRPSDKGVLGYHYLGMIRSQEQADAVKAQMAAAAGVSPDAVRINGLVPAPGMLYYQDVRGPKDATGQYTAPDGKIGEEDQDYLTNKSSNHYSLGLNFGGGYKGLSLNVTMGMSFGGQSLVEGDARALSKATDNRPEFWSDHWTPTNTNAAYPAPYYADSYTLTSSFWFRNSYTFKITNINLSYTLPAAVTKKMGIASIKAFAVATNPFNFYNPFTYRDNATPYNVYPTLKTVSFGLNVGF